LEWTSGGSQAVIKLEISDPPGDVLFAATALFPKIKRDGVSVPASILFGASCREQHPDLPARA
jgi:hypothetical protein